MRSLGYLILAVLALGVTLAAQIQPIPNLTSMQTPQLK
jgi:hypothetical protein